MKKLVRLPHHPNLGARFGRRLICRCFRCRTWRLRVIDHLKAEQSWEPGAGAKLRAHPEVFDALVG